MKKLTTNEIRNIWLSYFESKEHQVLESASLLPKNDPTLLWIGAGVSVMKKFFDGSEVPTSRRMVNSQKCLRTTDIDNVGRTARHHTFFEMLGNFSIGDYFRKEALEWGFELLTSDEYFGFDLDKLYFTVYPTDEETYSIWKNLGVSESHIIKTEYNFWEIGEGPCGPCTEIFYDRGEKYGDFSTDVIRDDIENDRYIEIWNIVLSQYNSKPGLQRSEYPELPSKNIDTGMGLERMACVLQGVETNYETDGFMPIIEEVSRITGVEYQGQMAFKVIADHLRTVTFALADGAMLGNEGRGYVLRRILRRAVRYGKILGKNEPFMFNLVDKVIEVMGSYYSYLEEKKDLIKKVIEKEEIRFHQTIEDGEKRLNSLMEEASNKVIAGKDAFTLYDTYGFPFELTLEYALESGYDVDRAGFEKEMEDQKERARASRGKAKSMSSQNEEMINFTDESKFVGYDNLSTDGFVTAVFKDGVQVQKASGLVEIVFDNTPFYAESGGQTFDKGSLELNGEVFEVTDVQKMPNGQHLHSVELSEVSVGDKMVLKVDESTRLETVYNHSATHLLHQALKDVLGSHVNQQGSQVTEEALRFDFNHIENVTDQDLLKIEEIVNAEISKAVPVEIVETSIEQAKEMGAQALFGEKYGDVVRVINMDYSIELCGGTHVSNTSEISRFAFKSIESKGSGIYRVEGLTKDNIEKGLIEAVSNYNHEIDNVLSKANKIVEEAKKMDFDIIFDYTRPVVSKLSYQDVINHRVSLGDLKTKVKNLQKDFDKKVSSMQLSDLSSFEDKFELVEGVNFLNIEVSSMDMKVLKEIVDNLGDKHNPSIISIANVFESKVTFVAKVSKELITDEIQASKLVKMAAQICSGNGGGRPDFAQAGAKDVTKVKEALLAVEKLVKSNS